MEVVKASNDFWRKNLRNENGYFTQKGEKFWTGPRPGPNTPGMCKDGTITSLPFLNTTTNDRNDILRYFENTWFMTEVLFSGLKNEEAFYRPPYHSLRHPMIFYYAHPAALYINKLRVAELIEDPVNAEYEILFETGVDEMSWDDMSKNEMEWPSLNEVREYRRDVYNVVHDIIRCHPGFDHLPITWDDKLWSIYMGIEHERIHIETSSVLIRELPIDMVSKPDQWPKYHPKLLDNTLQPHQDVQGAHLEIEFIEIPCGDIVIGKAKDWPSYGWDNEYGCRKFTLDKFYTSTALITNGQYLEFVRDKGYLEQTYWTEEGWKWKAFRNIKWPTFWIPIGPAGLHEYKLRLIFEIVDLPLEAPAVVNKHESVAYCNWLSKKHNLDNHLNYRLLTETEHQKIQDINKKDNRGRYAEDYAMMYSGDQLKDTYNISFAYGAESPVKALKPNKKGLHDVNGNLWEWCEDHFSCLPENIGIHPMYDDFSVPCYDGEHTIIQGGSFMTSGNSASIFSRYHFRPHFFQHAGFRIVRPTTTNMQLSHIDSPPPHVGNWNPTSSKSVDHKQNRKNAIQELLMSEFPNDVIPKLKSFNLPFEPFGHSFVSHLMSTLKQLNMYLESVLNVGSSVGGLCFDMTKHAKRIVGIEMDTDLIKIANKIKTEKFIYTEFPEELDVVKKAKIAPEAEFEKVEFKRMDPCAMAPDIGVYDCVIVSHILEQIASPKALLVRMGGPRGIVKKGGLLVIACTGDWDSKVVPKQLWLNAKYSDNDKNEKVELEKSLKMILGKDFEKVSGKDIPLFIPKTSRKYILKISDVSIWKRI